LTRQEIADAIVATGLDAQSLQAILEALESIDRTGWGEVVLTIRERQVSEWSANVRGKPAKDRNNKVKS